MAAQVGGKCAAAVQIKELLAASAGDKKKPLRELYWQWLSACANQGVPDVGPEVRLAARGCPGWW